ncbi:MAG TPA: hypothetical protein VK176_00090 [Phycisphaerales bacterium]|nr:hypothetical protein [Phycisphaerales bacterium]
MSTLGRQSPGVSSPLRVEAASSSPGVERVFEASWLVSRRALGTSRPDFTLLGSGPEVVLRWQVCVQEVDGAWSLSRASAVVGGSPRGGDIVILALDAESAGHELAVVVDRAAMLISLRLCTGGREVLSLSVPVDSAGPAYARTSLLWAAGPDGLGVGGGRYELERVVVEMVGGN